MSTGTIVSMAIVAVLLFWVVGAHNRLVAMRSQIVALFAPLDAQLRQRHLLLREQAQSLAGSVPGVRGDLDALHAALSQAEAACNHARSRPGAVGAVAALRLAEDVLLGTRARLVAQWHGHPALADSGARLAANEAALEFARRRFNEAVAEYNDAVRQFPTWLVAALFGFGVSATL